jgi:type VI protein secretion system component VasF
MPVAHAIDPTSGPPSSTASAERSHTASWAVVLAAVAALTLALLGWGYLAAGAGDGYPDPTQQWTD